MLALVDVHFLILHGRALLVERWMKVPSANRPAADIQKLGWSGTQHHLQFPPFIFTKKHCVTASLDIIRPGVLVLPCMSLM